MRGLPPCAAWLVTRLLARHEPPLAVMADVALVATSCPPGRAWRAPEGGELLALILIGVFGPLGQYVNIIAIRTAEASALAPIDDTRLIFDASAGYLLFVELPDRWTLLGAAIIICSTLFITRHEARIARPITQAPPADPLSEPFPAPAATPQNGDLPCSISRKNHCS